MSRRPSRARIARAVLAEAPGASLVVVLLAALLAGGASAAAAWASDARSQVLRTAVEASPPSQRDPGDATRGIPLPRAGGSDHGLSPEVAAVWGATFDSLDAIAADAEPAAAAVLEPPRAAVRFDPTPAVPVSGAAAPDSRIILSADPLLDRLVDVVEGELPGPVVAGEPVPIALTVPIAQAFGWELGEVRAVHYSSGDRELRLTGLVEARDPDAGEWDHAAVALQPEVIPNLERPPTYVGVGYLNAASVSELQDLAAASRFEAWLPVDTGALDADAADETVGALRHLESSPHTVPLLTDWGAWDVDVSLTGTTASIISATAPLLAGVVALHAAISAGVVLAAAGVLALVVRALVARRRGLLRLVAARGASDGTRAGALALGAGVLALLGAVPAAIVVLAVSGSAPVPAVIAAACVVVFAAGAGALDAALLERSGVRPDDADRRRTRIRVSLDAGIVLLAVAAAVTVLLTPAAPRSAAPPVAVLLPALVTAAACVLALRLVPLVVRGVEAIARRMRGLVSLVGPARAGRDATTGVVPVLALVAAVTIAVLGSGLLATVEGGVDEAVDAQVGADVRVDARYLSAADLAAVSETAGVRSIAVVSSDPDLTLAFPDGDGRVTVYLVDPDALADASTSELEVPDAGALVSETVAVRLSGAPLEVDGTELPIVATAPDDGPFGRASAWIAVAPATAEELGVDAVPTTVLVATTPSAREEVRAALAERFAASGTVRTVDQVLAVRRGAPAVQALVTGAAVAVVAAAALTVLAAILSLTAGAGARAREFGLLRALGARSRAEYALVLWELLPALAVAVPLGIGAGLALVPLVARAGDLAVFTGGSAQPSIVLGLGASLAVVALVVVVVLLGVLLAAALARRSGASRAVRSIDEEG